MRDDEAALVDWLMSDLPDDPQWYQSIDAARLELLLARGFAAVVTAIRDSNPNPAAKRDKRGEE